MNKLIVWVVVSVVLVVLILLSVAIVRQKGGLFGSVVEPPASPIPPNPFPYMPLGRYELTELGEELGCTIEELGTTSIAGYFWQVVCISPRGTFTESPPGALQRGLIQRAN